MIILLVQKLEEFLKEQLSKEKVEAPWWLAVADACVTLHLHSLAMQYACGVMKDQFRMQLEGHYAHAVKLIVQVVPHLSPDEYLPYLLKPLRSCSSKGRNHQE